MNKILIPTDFSEYSNYALEYGSFIAKEKGCKLFILHIVRHKKDKESTALIKKLNDIKDLKYLKGIDFEIVLEEGGTISKAITKAAEKHKVDLIIMGSNGVSNIEEMLLGSNTENVIRHSKINVLTIKHKMDGLHIKSILFPSDFSPEAFTVFKTVVDFAKTFNAQIHLLTVSTLDNFIKKEDIEEKMDLFISYFKLKKNYTKVISEDVNQELGILNYCIDNSIDMIAIGTHGKGVLKKLLKESTSQNLVRDAFRPVLTMKF
jgi:nucleotide-binding universal stress UspA family protein